MAIAALVAAVLVRWLLDPWMGDALPLVTLFGAVAAAVWVAGTGSGAVEGEESLREPNQRVRRFPPLLALLGCSAPATEVLQAPGASASLGLLVVVDHCGEALAVRVGAGSG